MNLNDLLTTQLIKKIKKNLVSEPVDKFTEQQQKAYDIFTSNDFGLLREPIIKLTEVILNCKFPEIIPISTYRLYKMADVIYVSLFYQSNTWYGLNFLDATKSYTRIENKSPVTKAEAEAYLTALGSANLDMPILEQIETKLGDNAAKQISKELFAMDLSEQSEASTSSDRKLELTL